MLRILLRAIRTALRHASPGSGPDARIGAVSFLHRFGAALNPHFHFHLVVLDGVFTETDGEVRFHEATHFSADDAGTVAPVLQRRILRLFQRRGLLDEHTVDDMLTWQGTGGFSLDAAARIHGSDREKRRAVASRYRNAPNEGLQWTCGIILLPQTREVIMVLFRPEATPGNGAPELEIRVHYDPDLRPEDVTTVDGIPVTTPARTLLDLATCVDDDELEQALAQALQRGADHLRRAPGGDGPLPAPRGADATGRVTRGSNRLVTPYDCHGLLQVAGAPANNASSLI